MQILIMDRVTVKVMSQSCKMADITDQGISCMSVIYLPPFFIHSFIHYYYSVSNYADHPSVVEELFKRREPMPGMDAIYFIQPSKEKYQYPLLAPSMDYIYIYIIKEGRTHVSLSPFVLIAALSCFYPTCLAGNPCTGSNYNLPLSFFSLYHHPHHLDFFLFFLQGIYLFQFHYPQRIGQSHQK